MRDSTLHTFYLHGNIRTLSPLHISSTDECHFDQRSGHVGRGSHIDKTSSGDGEKARKGPATGIQRLGIASGEASGPVYLPVITANNVMGHLRRHAAAIVCDVFIKRGERISPAVFNVLNCGAASGNPDASRITYAEYTRNRANLYMGVFGGGPKLMRRYVRMNNALPRTEASSVILDAFPHPLGLDSQTYRDFNAVVGSFMYVHLDDLERLGNPELAKSVVVDFEDSYAERQDKIKKQREATSARRKEGKENEAKTERTATTAMYGVEFVLPNVDFPVVWELRCTKAQLGFFLKVLERFVATDRLGGHSRNGFGQFALNELTLSGEIADEPGADADPIGGLISNRELDSSNRFVRDCLDEFEYELAEMSVAELDDLLSTKAGKPSAEEAETEAA